MASSETFKGKRGPGRPRSQSVAQHFNMPLALSMRLDDWIAVQPDPKPSRPEAIRELLKLGIDATIPRNPE